MHQLLLDLPNQLETDRLLLRSYQAGDGPWYYAMSRKNKTHLAQFESGNAVMSINSEEDAEIVVRDYAADWVARKAFFMGAFLKSTQEFVAQIYVRSYRVAERCGMVREGHIRENKKNADGRMSGTLIYGLLRSEYETHKT